jgi:hypothetical protein
MAAILNVPEGILADAIEKLEQTGRVSIKKSGVITINNWEKYQYTDYDRQKQYRQKKQDERPIQDILAETGQTIHEYLKEQGITIREWMETHPEITLAGLGWEYMTDEEIAEDKASPVCPPPPNY